MLNLNNAGENLLIIRPESIFNWNLQAYKISFKGLNLLTLIYSVFVSGPATILEVRLHAGRPGLAA
jgi:hypothetical protein